MDHVDGALAKRCHNFNCIFRRTFLFFSRDTKTIQSLKRLSRGPLKVEKSSVSKPCAFARSSSTSSNTTSLEWFLERLKSLRAPEIASHFRFYPDNSVALDEVLSYHQPQNTAQLDLHEIRCYFSFCYRNSIYGVNFRVIFRFAHLIVRILWSASLITSRLDRVAMFIMRILGKMTN